MPASFATNKNMKEMLDTLIKERKDIFDYVDPSMILCLSRTDKPQPKSQKWIVKIEGVTGTKSMLNPEISYIIWSYDGTWESLDDTHKMANLANMLIRIKKPSLEEEMELAEKGEDFEWGKLVKPDINDFTAFIKAFGIDWNHPKATVPDILDPSIKIHNLEESEQEESFLDID
jgi:hypothetical protein